MIDNHGWRSFQDKTQQSTSARVTKSNSKQQGLHQQYNAMLPKERNKATRGKFAC